MANTINVPDLLYKYRKFDEKTMGLSHFHDLVLTKSSNWAYEEEWRLIERKDKQTYPPVCHDSIIFGHKMTEKNRITLRNIMKNREIKYVTAQPLTSTRSH